jgi:mono/diheme cytochrome c family protein
VRWGLRTVFLWSTAALVAGCLLMIGAILVISEWKLRRTYPQPSLVLTVDLSDVSVERGEHLVRAVGTCTLCHGEDLGGAIYADMAQMGRIVGPNLTLGRGGVGAAFSTDDWVRAIRVGVRRDGTSLIVMPSEVFCYFSDRDLASIIAYLRQLPPIDRELPPTRFGPIGRALLAAGRLNILVAPKTRAGAASAPMPEDASEAYGRYLADVSGCHGCHGLGLSGGRVAGPPNLPIAANLTPTGVGSWVEADFIRAMREGIRPDGRRLDEFMPFRTYSGMTDVELHALWNYLRSVPARPTGNK